MDYETLGDAIFSDISDDSDLYIKVREGEEFRPTGAASLEKAKGFLSSVNPRLNISLYDHLADVLKKILRSQIPDAADLFEKLSLQVKKTRLPGESDLTEVVETGEDLQNFLKEKQIFYKFLPPATDIAQEIKTADEDDEDDDSEDEDEEVEPEAESKEDIEQPPTADLAEVLPDLHYIFSRFRQAGICLSPEEIYELNVALKDLATEFKLRRVRFWGKVFGTKNDYYVAEAPFQEGVIQEDFGWTIVQEPDKTEEEDAEKTEEKEDDDDDEEEEEEKEEEEQKEDDQENEESEQAETPQIPPIPQHQAKDKKRVPPEENGTGVNEYLYFVCTRIGQPWRVLPYMKPLHIVEARYLKRFFIGDLESQVRGCIPFPGKEAHYLRAQIARITASTYIAPQDFYKRAGENEDDEEEEDEEKEDQGNGMSVNEEYVPRPTKYLHSEGLDAWVHYRRALLDQGRCTPMKLENENDDEKEEEEEPEEEEDEDKPKEEEEEPEILEAIVETEVPILRSLSEDKALGRLQPWTSKLSSKMVSETAVLIMYSNLWPGAYTFYDGKTFEHVYLGYGCKYCVFHYAPPIRVAWQAEYPVGEDVTEQVDEEVLPVETVEDEEAEVVEEDDAEKEEGEDEEGDEGEKEVEEES